MITHSSWLDVFLVNAENTQNTFIILVFYILEL